MKNNINITNVYKDAPGLDPNLSFNDYFAGIEEELTENDRAIEHSEDVLFKKLFGEFGRRFAYLVLSDDEHAKLFTEAPKDVSVAIDYIPNHIALLKSINPEADDLCYGLFRYLNDMELANYSEEDIDKFSLVWIDAVENLEMLDIMQLQFYLLGKYETGETRSINAATKKDFKRALEFIPTWIHGVRVYDHDEELCWMVKCMRKHGYSEDEITLFATRYINELDIGNTLWYSSMHMQLFSEHVSGARLDIPGLGDFESAVSLLPRYVDYLVHFEGIINEMQDHFDLDHVLYSLINKMRKHGFSEAQINYFATEWINAVEMAGSDSYMRMFAYLFGEIFQVNSSEERPFKGKIALSNKKDFEKAVSYIPSWMAFLNDFETRFAYGYSPDSAVLTVLKKMCDSRYEAEIIEKFLLRVTECDISLMEIVYAIYKDGKYKNVELAKLKSMEKYTALTTK